MSETPPPGIPEEGWCKNRLQLFTQKASLPLPMYETFDEGAQQHPPRFRSRVWVDGKCYTSPLTFSTKKKAEQDAAKHALTQVEEQHALTRVQEKVKPEECSCILEHFAMGKSIINEYALKMSWNPPTYVTNPSKTVVPVFVTSLVLNEVTFIGDAARNKKMSEQYAARSAILHILASESGTTMSDILKSKLKFCDGLTKGKDSSDVQGDVVPAGSNQIEEMGTIGTIVNASIDTIPPSSIAPSPAIQVAYSQPPNQLQHVFKKAEPETSSTRIDVPIVFVPPASEQPPVSSTSAKKRKRKNKKAKQNAMFQSQATASILPQPLLQAWSMAPNEPSCNSV